MKKSRPERKTGFFINCKQCNAEIYVRKCEAGKKFCSIKCAGLSKKKYIPKIKNCSFCGKEFKYSQKPFSNSSGKYCSLKCRNDAYSKNTDKYGFKKHRSRWRSFRNLFILKNNNFCNDCFDTSKRLMVHHIIPYRIVLKNENQNLVSLCGKCHSKHEKISDKLAVLPIKNAEDIRNIIQANFEEKWHLYHGKKISEEQNARN